MRCLSTFKLISIFILITTFSYAENFTISLYFEQTEEALNNLFKAQAFPHPIGDHNGDSFDIYLWEPQIELETGTVRFVFTIRADLIINGTQQHYSTSCDIPLSIPSGELSVSGITTLLEGISDQISSMDGPQWVKDIINSKYEGLELTLYPGSLLEAANASIPGFIDVSVGDIHFIPEVLPDLIRYTLSIDIEGNSPFILGRWSRVSGRTHFDFTFNPNIDTNVLYIGVYTSFGTEVNEVEFTDKAINANEWSDTIRINSSNQTIIPLGYYYCKVLFGTSYGWFGVNYGFNNSESIDNGALIIQGTL